MPPRKPAAITSKVSSASARPKKSAKENPQPRSSTFARPTSASEPLQTQTSSSNVAKDAELAALVASLRAEVDRLKKHQAANPKENKSEEIPRPTKITAASLQDAMGLTDDKKLYTFCRSAVRDVVFRSGLPTSVDWRNQDPDTVAKIAGLARSTCKQLQLYKGNWATLEIMKTLVKNRRTYRRRIGTVDYEQDMTKEEREVEGDHEGGDDEERDHEERDNEEGDNEEGNNEEGNNSDSWDDMYQADKERRFDIDEGDIGGNKGGDGADNEDEDEDADANRMDVGGSRDEGGSGDGDVNNGKGSCGVSGRKDDAGRKGMKRKDRDDEPAARAKRTKKDVSGGHRAGTQPTKKTQPKRNASKKN